MKDLPLVLCGPIVRRTVPDRVCIWIALRQPCTVELEVFDSEDGAPGVPRLIGRRDTISLGEHLHVAVVSATANAGDAWLDWGQSYFYDLSFAASNAAVSNAAVSNAAVSNAPRRLRDEGVLGFDVANAEPLQQLVYEGRELPGFRLPAATLSALKVVHGSCRKPHGKGKDALAILDELLAGSDPPQVLFLTGDQIYVDEVDPADEVDAKGDVPRGLLHAIVDQGAELFGGEDRERAVELAGLAHLFEAGKRGQLVAEHGSYTSSAADCHLVTLVELYTMYLFQWSDVLWHRNGIAKRESLAEFYEALPKVRRALANISTYMIFDDHDVTDDWNRTDQWVGRVAASPLGNRMVRNALTAYSLFQHWGNDPEAFEQGKAGEQLLSSVEGWDGTSGDRADEIRRLLSIPSSGADLKVAQEGTLRWNFGIETPACRVVVLDTRTRRRFLSPEASPGLMCKAALDEVLDPSLPSMPVTLVVSPAPVLGVGLIEFIQDKVAGLLDIYRDESELVKGKDKYDAEAWVFDPEINDYLLERLAGLRRVVLLSGDVHYGFGGSLVASEIDARIVNFVSSALHNEVFAERLSKVLNFLVGSRQLEARTSAEAAPSAIPEGAIFSERLISKTKFREELLHEGGDGPQEPNSMDLQRGDMGIRLEGLPGSQRRADVVGSSNLGEITFPKNKVQQRLRWLGRRGRQETLHVAGFPID